MSYYIITDDNPENQLFWNNTNGWSCLEDAEVYTNEDLLTGVKLPIGGKWMRITPEGIDFYNPEED